MENRPPLARDIYERYVTATGDVTWPDDDQERTLLARALYGRQLVDTLDCWLSHVIDLVENPEPAEPFLRRNEAYEKDKYFRDRFTTLSAEQKLAVRNPVYTIAHGLLFSVLVDVDRGDYGTIVLGLIPRNKENEVQAVQIAPGECFDLHDELNDWILSFSRFADQLVELTELKGAWQLGPKRFYRE